MTPRRLFLKQSAAATLSGSLFAAAPPRLSAAPPTRPLCNFNLNGPELQIFTPKVTKPYKILFVSDTHLTFEDDRDRDYQIYSKRMAGAHQKKKHFQTGKDTSPQASFEAALEMANDYDAFILGGDILNFPSQLGVEWLMEKLGQLRTPWRYIAGNHDWHYEGLPGSSETLRIKWIQKRLAPLYQGANPLAHHLLLNEELQLLLIDNSTYTITPEQSDFVKSQLQSGKPALLFQHIPFYARGRTVGYGCAHPEWGASTDKHFTTERRERWPENGHSATTLNYRKLAIQSPDLLATFSGHVHQFSTELIEGLPQFVVKEHACGAYYHIEVLPA